MEVRGKNQKTRGNMEKVRGWRYESKSKRDAVIGTSLELSGK